MANSNILVLGATGASGLAFINEALSRPPSTRPSKLTLYVRSPNKLPDTITSSPDVLVVVGELTDQTALEGAMRSGGVNTIISFLGAYLSISAAIFRTRTTPLADHAFPTLFRAMRSQGVKRILALSTPSYQVDSPEESHTWSMAAYLLIPKTLAPQGNAEMVAIATAVAAQEDFDWTVFRIPLLNDGAAELRVCAGLWGPGFRGSLGLSRPSMARWLLEELEVRRWVKGAPALGNM